MENDGTRVKKAEGITALVLRLRTPLISEDGRWAELFFARFSEGECSSGNVVTLSSLES